MAFRKKQFIKNVRASVTQDLAVVYDESNGDVVIAACRNDAEFESAADSIISMRFSIHDDPGKSLSERIDTWLQSNGIWRSHESSFLIVPESYSERTKILFLNETVLTLDDDALTSWLVDAAQKGLSGEDSQPLFDAPLAEMAADFTRLPSGYISLTDVPRKDVTAMARKIVDASQASSLLNLPENEQPFLPVRAETKLRAILRWFLLTSFSDTQADFDGAQELVTAVFAATSQGTLVGLWSPGRGLFYEYGETHGMSEDEGFGEEDSLFEDDEFAAFMGTEQNVVSDEETSRLRAESIQHAVNRLSMRISPARLKEMGFSGVSCIVFCASMDVEKDAFTELTEFANSTGLTLLPLINMPLEEIVACGLLAGSLEEEEATAKIPVINLASDLRDRAAQEVAFASSIENAKRLQQRRTAVFAMVVPFIICFGLILGVWLNTKRVAINLSYRQAAAEKESARLKPIAEQRRAFEGNFRWFEGYIKQIIDLRKQQTAAIGLYADLDSRYPLTEDPTFYVSEVRTSPTGQIEIKGLTKNQAAVTSFVRSLEMSGTDSSGRKLFLNLQPEFREGVPQVQGVPNMPQMPSSNLGGSNLAPGVVAWTIKGSYSPLAIQKVKSPVPPQQPTKNQGLPPGTNPVPNNPNSTNGSVK